MPRIYANVDQQKQFFKNCLDLYNSDTSSRKKQKRCIRAAFLLEKFYIDHSMDLTIQVNHEGDLPEHMRKLYNNRVFKYLIKINSNIERLPAHITPHKALEEFISLNITYQNDPKYQEYLKINSPPPIQQPTTQSIVLSYSEMRREAEENRRNQEKRDANFQQLLQEYNNIRQFNISCFPDESTEKNALIALQNFIKHNPEYINQIPAAISSSPDWNTNTATSTEKFHFIDENDMPPPGYSNQPDPPPTQRPSNNPFTKFKKKISSLFNRSK